MTKYLALILAALIIAGIAAGGFLFFTPNLVSYAPAEGAEDVSGGTRILLNFSRPVLSESVKSHLIIEPGTEGNLSQEGNSFVFSPEKPWKAGETIHIRLEAGIQADDSIKLKTRKSYTWSFKIRKPRLAYLYPSDAAANIYSVDIDTGDQKVLTKLPGGVLDYDVNPSGTAIYLTAKNGEGGSSIYKLILAQNTGEFTQNKESDEPADTEKLVTVLDCGEESCRNPKISPSGKYLAFERIAPIGSENPTYPQVWLLILDETSASNPAPFRVLDNLHQTMFPDWSSENILVFYDSTAGAFTFLNPKTKNSTQVFNDTGQPGSWHPNGYEYIAPEIIIVELKITDEPNSNEQVGSSHLILYNLKDSTSTDLTLNDTLEDTWPAYSPDGKLLAFARKYLDKDNWTPGRQIWLMHHNTREAHPITNDPLYNHFELSWSPSGKFLAYEKFDQSTLTDPPEIWVIDVETTIARQIAVGGYIPQWIP